MDKRDRLVCRDSDSSYNMTDLSLILLATILKSFLAFIIVYLLTWHYAGTRHTYMSMHACTFHFPMHIAFLLLAHGFAHVLVSPAINNMENVLYIVAGQFLPQE